MSAFVLAIYNADRT